MPTTPKTGKPSDNGTARPILKVKSHAEADQVLAEYIALTLEIQTIEAKHNPKIQALKDAMAAETGGRLQRAGELMAQVVDYFDKPAVRDAVLAAKGSNQVQLDHGLVQYRKSPDSVGFLDGFDEEKAIEKIQAHKTLARLDWVKIERKLVKGKLKGQDDNLLAEVGILVVPGDVKTTVTANITAA